MCGLSPVASATSLQALQSPISKCLLCFWEFLGYLLSARDHTPSNRPTHTPSTVQMSPSYQYHPAPVQPGFNQYPAPPVGTEHGQYHSAPIETRYFQYHPMPDALQEPQQSHNPLIRPVYQVSTVTQCPSDEQDQNIGKSCSISREILTRKRLTSVSADCSTELIEPTQHLPAKSETILKDQGKKGIAI